MIIAMAVATIAMMGVIVYLNIRLNNHEGDNNIEIESLNDRFKRLEKLDESIDRDLDSAELKIASNRNSIEEIIEKLESIAKDIKRLDERLETDHKDLVDIRQRYILYKEPTVPVITTGVPWAKDVKCGDDYDFTEEQKIKILEEEKKAYEHQLKEELSPLDKLAIHRAYLRCIGELNEHTKNGVD